MMRSTNSGTTEPDPLMLEDIADALISVMETQEAIMRMLWSIRNGVPNSAFLDDSDFQHLKMRRGMASNTLQRKSMAAKLKKTKQ